MLIFFESKDCFCLHLAKVVSAFRSRPVESRSDSMVFCAEGKKSPRTTGDIDRIVPSTHSSGYIMVNLIHSYRLIHTHAHKTISCQRPSRERMNWRSLLFLFLTFPFASCLRSFGTPRHVRSTSNSMTVSPNRWNDRYAESDEYAYGTVPNDFWKDVLPTLQLQPGAKCLFLAEGEGRNAVYGAQQGLHCTAVDNSPVGLQKAQLLASSRNVSLETILADLNEYNLGTNQWDCIVGIFAHIPPPVREKVLNAIPDALRTNGYVVFECYTPEQLEYKTGGPPDTEWMYTKDMMHECFHESLHIVRNENVIRNVVEGKYHTGKASVIQFVGRKE